MPPPSARRRAPAHNHAKPGRSPAGRQRPSSGQRSSSRQRSAGGKSPAVGGLKHRSDDAKSQLDQALAAAAALPQPVATFAELGLDPRLVSPLAARDIREPFAIQARALPDALAGRDVLGRAETGSGKTLAVGLPLLSRVAVMR